METSVCHSQPDTEEFSHRQQVPLQQDSSLTAENDGAMVTTASDLSSTSRLERLSLDTDEKTTAAGGNLLRRMNATDDANNCRVGGNAGPAVKPKKSPVNSPGAAAGGSRHSIVEERARRYGGQSPSASKTSPTGPSPSWRKSTTPSPRHSGNSEGGWTPSSDHSSGGSDHLSPADSTVDGSIGSKPAFTSTPSSQMLVCQAPPPAEVLQMPDVAPRASALSISFEENIMAQSSARVEPSPERFFAPPELHQDIIRPNEAASYRQSAVGHCPIEAQSCLTGKTAQKDLKAFFGDSNVPVEEEHLNASDAASCENSSSAEVTECRRKPETTRTAGRKPPWVTGSKPLAASAAAAAVTTHITSTHSPSPRPRKPNEREPSSSPKQKEHKLPGASVATSASPPSQPSRDKSSSTAASGGSQPGGSAWKNPFKRHGSGSGLSAIDQGSSGPAAAAACGPAKAVFGVPLGLCQMSSTQRLVPLVVELCAGVVEEKGLENQGIYRVSGNSGSINMMIDELNKDPVNLSPDNDKWQDVNVVSGLLKLFFRKLPDPLMTDDLYTKVIKANQTENSERRMLKLKKLLHDLPEVNFETFRFLARHLSRIASREEVNKMDARNLAIMFGPSLIRPIEDSVIAMVRDMPDQCRIVESIILHWEWFFSSWDEDVNVPVDDEPEEATPISSSNQIMLAKAESLVAAASALSPPQTRREQAMGNSVLAAIIDAANRRTKNKKANRSTEPPAVCPKNSVGAHRGSTASNRSVENLLEQSSESRSSGTVSESDTNPEAAAAVADAEVSFEIKKAYRFEDNNVFYGVENTQPRIRRTKSNDSLLSGSRPRIMRHNVAPCAQGPSPLPSDSSSTVMPMMTSTQDLLLCTYPPPTVCTSRDDGIDVDFGTPPPPQFTLYPNNEYEM